MAFKIVFPADMKEGGSFGPLPLGEYPCQLHLRVYQTDQTGALMKGPDGQPVPFHTTAGDMLWYVDSEILDGPYAGKPIQDNWSFGKAIARVHAVCVRLGLIPEGYRGPFDINPDEIDGTYWWVTIDEHQVAERSGQVTVAQYPFKSACPCAICKAAVGRNVFVNAKVGFAGYRLMSKDEIKKYRAVAQQRQAAMPNGAADPDAPPF